MNMTADNMSSGAATATAFCSRYATLTLDYARWFLLLALLIGLAGAVVGFINSLRTPASPPPPGTNEAGGGALATTIDAVRNMIEAFSKAPVWVAMLGGGILLLWLAGNAGGCSGGLDQQGNQQVETSHRTPSNAVGNGAAPPTSNEAGGRAH